MRGQQGPGTLAVATGPDGGAYWEMCYAKVCYLAKTRQKLQEITANLPIVESTTPQP